MKFCTIALLGATASIVAAQPHQQHRHLHEKRGSPVEVRAASVTQYVEGPTVTVYELNGKVISAAEVEAGLASGKYILVGDSLSEASTAVTAATSTAAPTSTTASISTAAASTSEASTSSLEVAAFYEKPTSSSSSYVEISSSSSASSSAAATTSSVASTSAAASSSKASSTASASASTSTATGLTADFPSGELKCSDFPSDYGAISADWLGLGGWTGVQETPDYTLLDTVISEIVTAISGESCTENSFCSYACPAGYQKSQWPSAQGSTGQSIGGLYCNSDGYLELSNSNHTTLCIEGTGGVYVQNKLDLDVAVCRTDYPGLESETVPLNATSQSTNPLTCPDGATYFYWEGSATSAQYYVNPAGATVEEACQWGESGTDMGNWAPVNLGVGRDVLGVTYISLIPNSPTNPDGTLDFKIAIEGDTSGTCYYENGKYYDDSGENSDGCTVSHHPMLSTSYN
jgi:hypothetical protein